MVLLILGVLSQRGLQFGALRFHAQLDGTPSFLPALLPLVLVHWVQTVKDDLNPLPDKPLLIIVPVFKFAEKAKDRHKDAMLRDQLARGDLEHDCAHVLLPHKIVPRIDDCRDLDKLLDDELVLPESDGVCALFDQFPKCHLDDLGERAHILHELLKLFIVPTGCQCFTARKPVDCSFWGQRCGRALVLESERGCCKQLRCRCLSPGLRRVKHNLQCEHDRITTVLFDI
mmetsp:Transcript_21914/g.69969  ORF Transcript_21914/g.69969 Transcript_21914/m.69969 type:complete len:229 (-) Transcript_21914:856-1542(-)